MRKRGPFAVTLRSPGTLSGVFADTRLQFLHADESEPQRLLEKPTVVEGLRIAGISDLLAMKLKVVGQRGEARDYFDLMKIEQDTGRRVEEGLGLYLARYIVPPDQAVGSVDSIVRGLGYFGDVEEDEALPVSLAEIERYWQRRQPEVITYLDRFGAALPRPERSTLRRASRRPTEPGPLVTGAPDSAERISQTARGRVHVKGYRRADGTQVREHYRDR